MTLPRLAACAAAAAGIVLTFPAAAHLPHDVVSAVAVDETGDRIAVQYYYRKRPLMVVTADGGRSWAFRAAECGRELLEGLSFAEPDVVYGADGMAPYAYRSDDGGLTWSRTAEPDGTPVRQVAPTPNHAETPVVFAATDHGVWRSDDRGDTWRWLAGVGEGTAVDLAVSPVFADDPFVVVLTDEGDVSTSLDGGETWGSRSLGVAGERAYSLALTGPEDGVIWAGLGGGTLSRSWDRGTTWESIPLILGDEPLTTPIRDFVALSSGRLLAVTDEYAALCSEDRGTSWSVCDDGMPPPVLSQWGTWGHYRWIDRAWGDANLTAVGAWEGLMLSPDDGETWQESCFLMPTFVRAVTFSPAYPDDPAIWVGSYGGGLYETLDGGGSWSVLAADQYALHVESLALSPVFEPRPVMFLVADRQLLRSDDGGASFVEVDLGEIELMHSVVPARNFGEHGIAYAIGSGASEAQRFFARTVDGGETWKTVWAGESGGTSGIEAIARSADPDSNTIYARQSLPAAVLRSDSFGEQWQNLVTFEGVDGVAALFVIPDEQGDRLVAVDAAGGVWGGSSEDGGWEPLAEIGQEVLSGETAGRGSVLYLTTDPTGVMRSMDGGQTWSDVPTPFLTMINDLAFPPDHPDDPTIVASTHLGTFFTCDEGENWHLLDRLMRLEDGACPLRYAGAGWVQQRGRGTGGTVMLSAGAGDTLEFDFWGRAFDVLSPASDSGGSVSLYVDDQEMGQVQLGGDASGCAASAQPHFEFGEDGFHTVRLEVLGDGIVEIDAIEITRHSIHNGPDAVYEVGDWCIDLDDEAAGCSGASCEVTPLQRVDAILCVGLFALLGARRFRMRRAGAML